MAGKRNKKADSQPESAAERFARNVRRLRKSKFGNVATAVSQSGITQPRWYRAEQGKFDGMIGPLIVPMADAFGVDISELFKP